MLLNAPVGNYYPPHLAFIGDDSMPCGHWACPDVRDLTWISSTCAVVRCIIDHINNSKGKETHKQSSK